MKAMVDALAALARRIGVTMRFDAPVTEILLCKGAVHGVMLEGGERLEADAVVCNADAAALSRGLFGSGTRGAVPGIAAAERSLSAVTWCLSAVTESFPLARHNVFFSSDYKAEFDQI